MASSKMNVARGAAISAGAWQVVWPATVMAQSAAEQACKGAGGPWNAGGGTCTREGSTNLTDGFKTVANTLIFLVGAIAVIMLIIGGLRYVLSGGDSSAVKGAKDTILYALIGVIVAILAFAAVSFVVSQF